LPSLPHNKPYLSLNDVLHVSGAHAQAIPTGFKIRERQREIEAHRLQWEESSTLKCPKEPVVGVQELNSHVRWQSIVDAPLVEAGLADLRRFADKRLSLVDAVSFAVIRSLALDGSTTFDRDFRDCGIAVYPDS
jgi:hypothetical protein